MPVDLARHIRGHDVDCARDRGWQEFKDRELLDAVDNDYDVMITVDASIPAQQSLATRAFAIIVLRATTNRVGHLARLVPSLLRVLKDIEPGEVREIEE